MRELPDAWRRVRLWDCGTWFSGGTPSTDEPRFWRGDIPWISAASLKEFQLWESDRRITPAGSRAGTKMVDKGAVIFVVRGMSLKTEFRVGVAQRDLAFGQDCKAIIPDSGIDGTFLALAMKSRSRQILSMVDEAGHGTGRLPTDLIAKLEIGVPPLVEQRRIVEVLDAVDGELKAVDVALAKLSPVQSGLVDGLMADRFGSVRLGDLAAPEHGSSVIGPFGSNLTANDYRTSGRPVIFVRDIRIDGFRWVSNVYVGQRKAAELNAHVVQGGDLLITKMGLPPCVAAVYPMFMPPGIITADVIRIRPNKRVVDVHWLAQAVNHENFRQQVRMITGGVTRPKVTLKDIRSLAVTLPSLAEQREAMVVIKESVAEIDAFIAVKHELIRLKQGLMDDLLTGRVRVPTPREFKV